MAYTSDQIKKEYALGCDGQRADNLVYLREKIAKKSQKDFREELGFTSSDMSNMESGKKNLSLYHIHAYRKFFKENHGLNVSVDFLMGYTSVMENRTMNVSNELGLSGESIEILKIWTKYKKNKKLPAASYGNFDIDTLNMLLEDYHALYKKHRENGKYANYSIFHFIGNYIFSDCFKKRPQNIVKYTFPSEVAKTGKGISELKKGDVVVSGSAEKQIMDILTYDRLGNGKDSDYFCIYNVDNEDIEHSIPFQAAINAYNRECIIGIIDGIKERIRKN